MAVFQKATDNDDVMNDFELSIPEKEFVKVLHHYNESHEFRYARIDLLYWYEMQNRCCDVIQKYLKFLGQYEDGQEDQFAERYK